MIQNSSVDRAKITRSITNKSTQLLDAVTLYCLFYSQSPVKVLQGSRFSEFIAWIVSLITSNDTVGTVDVWKFFKHFIFQSTVNLPQSVIIKANELPNYLFVKNTGLSYKYALRVKIAFDITFSIGRLNEDTLRERWRMRWFDTYGRTNFPPTNVTRWKSAAIEKLHRWWRDRLPKTRIIFLWASHLYLLCTEWFINRYSWEKFSFCCSIPSLFHYFCQQKTKVLYRCLKRVKKE